MPVRTTYNKYIVHIPIYSYWFKWNIFLHTSGHRDHKDFLKGFRASYIVMINFKVRPATIFVPAFKGSTENVT